MFSTCKIETFWWGEGVIYASFTFMEHLFVAQNKEFWTFLSQLENFSITAFPITASSDLWCMAKGQPPLLTYLTQFLEDGSRCYPHWEWIVNFWEPWVRTNWVNLLSSVSKSFGSNSTIVRDSLTSSFQTLPSLSTDTMEAGQYYIPTKVGANQIHRYSKDV